MSPILETVSEFATEPNIRYDRRHSTMTETQMQGIDLSGLRVLLTQAEDFMGPALAEVFRELGAEVICDHGPMDAVDYPARMISQAGQVDVLLANLGIPAPSTLAQDASDEEWRHAFAHMVDPLPRISRALLPQMLTPRHCAVYGAHRPTVQHAERNWPTSSRSAWSWQGRVFR